MTTHRPVTGPDGDNPITDEQIRDLIETLEPGEHEIKQASLIALGASRYPRRIVDARTRCAAAYNAQHAGKEGR